MRMTRISIPQSLRWPSWAGVAAAPSPPWWWSQTPQSSYPCCWPCPWEWSLGWPAATSSGTITELPERKNQYDITLVGVAAAAVFFSSSSLRSSSLSSSSLSSFILPLLARPDLGALSFTCSHHQICDLSQSSSRSLISYLYGHHHHHLCSSIFPSSKLSPWSSLVIFNSMTNLYHLAGGAPMAGVEVDVAALGMTAKSESLSGSG